MCCAKPEGCCKCCFADDEKADLCCYKEGGHLRAFVTNYYAPAIKNPIFKGVVILIFVGFFVFGIIVTPMLSENFSLRFFVPSDNPLLQTFDIADKEFNNKNGISVDIMIDHQKANNEVASAPCPCLFHVSGRRLHTRTRTQAPAPCRHPVCSHGGGHGRRTCTLS